VVGGKCDVADGGLRTVTVSDPRLIIRILKKRSRALSSLGVAEPLWAEKAALTFEMCHAEWNIQNAQ